MERFGREILHPRRVILDHPLQVEREGCCIGARQVAEAGGLGLGVVGDPLGAFEVNVLSRINEIRKRYYLGMRSKIKYGIVDEIQITAEP